MLFHVLWLVGVYAHEPGRGVVEWREHEELGDASDADRKRACCLPVGHYLVFAVVDDIPWTARIVRVQG